MNPAQGHDAGLTIKQSQVLEIMFVRELASRLPNPTPVSVSVINPGFCHSRLTRSIEGNLVVSVAVRVAKALLARTAEMGSRTLVHSAVEPGERARHGRYASCCEVTEESDYVLSEEGKQISRRLWVRVLVFFALLVHMQRVWLTRILLCPFEDRNN